LEVVVTVSTANSLTDTDKTKQYKKTIQVIQINKLKSKKQAKLPFSSHLLQLLARKQGGFILQLPRVAKTHGN